MITKGSPRKKRVSDPFRFDRALLTELTEAEPGGKGKSADLRLAGADEAGRGCLAGPLVAAAVVLDYARAPFPRLDGLTDSKLLSPEAREAMYGRILGAAVRVSWVACSPSTIDRDGLHRSNLAALRRAIELLRGEYRVAVIDGFDLKHAELRARALPGADYKSAAAGAASIVAKVVRDRLMRAIAPSYPEYGFEEHVGYATDQHREAIRLHGTCVLHRLSFRGVGTTQLELWDE